MFGVCFFVKEKFVLRMDRIKQFELERDKKFYNIMSLEVFDHLDPKTELKIRHEDLKFKQKLDNWNTTPVYMRDPEAEDPNEDTTPKGG